MSHLMHLLDPYNYQAISSAVKKTLTKSLEEINHSLNDTPSEILILTIVWESGDPAKWKDEFQQFVSQIKKIHTSLKIIVIFDNWFKPYQLNFFNVDEIFYINFWIYKVYESLIVQRTSEIATEWKSDASKVLFLTGKAHKIQRTRLLYKLLNSELKPDLDWSYQIRHEDLAESLVFLNDITSDELIEFLHLSYSNLDGHLNTYLGSRGIKFDPAIYKNSVLQIISETNFDRPLLYPFVTEKIWVSIANRRPFVIAGEIGYLDFLKSIGIRTFDQCLLMPNYDNPNQENFLDYNPESGRNGKFIHTQEIQHWNNFYQNFRDTTWPEHVPYNQVSTLPDYVQQEIKQNYRHGQYSIGEIRLDAIVANSIFFKNNAKKNESLIKQDIEHNFLKFLELAQYEKSQLANLCVRQKLTCQSLYDVFEIFIKEKYDNWNMWIHWNG